ncbi:uncharacterized protein C8R40DRAFT_1176946 [Lentinula edodes]|uniref:uncharacterized protein n=1 Tax=Lentinula edodes TaxID=5353 RepID=UPI001E8DE0E4|nr:uncharacterized protein C8R40DRAFT_1177669 [Lentinula edodes]XP_046080366.1 uncharacterized protein C8R40DRAFT_1176946 [Lentinula edodes]KAH7868588.1 hypothetical protein C8R40DRAFT_1177669 [Lentinula edodes]KAH7869272.1 hypothetical protein C8R40DRAFT_1176946 [Lentinula edodes]
MLPQLQQSSSSPLTTPPTPPHLPKLSTPIAHRLLQPPSAQKPLPLQSIGNIVKFSMEDLRESFLRVEEFWYEPEYDGSVIKLVKDADSPEEAFVAGISSTFSHRSSCISARSSFVF